MPDADDAVWQTLSTAQRVFLAFEDDEQRSLLGVYSSEESAEAALHPRGGNCRDDLYDGHDIEERWLDDIEPNTFPNKKENNRD